jgi:hypothetical protein
MGLRNLRTRVEKMERVDTSPRNSCLGLSERMRTLEDQEEGEGTCVHEPGRPVDPRSLAGRLLAQCERDAACELSAGDGDAA